MAPAKTAAEWPRCLEASPPPVSGSNLRNARFPHGTLPASVPFLLPQLGLSKTDPGQGVGVI